MSDPQPTLSSQADVLIDAVRVLGTNLKLSNDAIVKSNAKIAESNRAIATLSDSVKLNAAQQRRLRIWQIITIIGLCLDLALSVGFIYNQHKANTAIKANTANALALCKVSNQARADADTLWNKVLTVSSTASPSQRATIESDLALANSIYAQRSCK